VPRGSEIEPTTPRRREEARKVARETGAEKETGIEETGGEVGPAIVIVVAVLTAATAIIADIIGLDRGPSRETDTEDQRAERQAVGAVARVPASVDPTARANRGIRTNNRRNNIQTRKDGLRAEGPPRAEMAFSNENRISGFS